MAIVDFGAEGALVGQIDIEAARRVQRVVLQPVFVLLCAVDDEVLVLGPGRGARPLESGP